jgi:hypothetical protein
MTGLGAVRAALTIAALAGALGVFVDLVHDSAEREVAAQERRARLASERPPTG